MDNIKKIFKFVCLKFEQFLILFFLFSFSGISYIFLAPQSYLAEGSIIIDKYINTQMQTTLTSIIESKFVSDLVELDLAENEITNEEGEVLNSYDIQSSIKTSYRNFSPVIYISYKTYEKELSTVVLNLVIDKTIGYGNENFSVFEEKLIVGDYADAPKKTQLNKEISIPLIFLLSLLISPTIVYTFYSITDRNLSLDHTKAKFNMSTYTDYCYGKATLSNSLSSLIDYYREDGNGVLLNFLTLDIDQCHKLEYRQLFISDCSLIYNKIIIVDISKQKPEIIIWSVLDKKNIKYQPNINLCNQGFPEELVKLANVFLSKSINSKYLKSVDFKFFLNSLKKYYDLVIVDSGFLFEQFNLIELLKSVNVNLLSVFQGVTRMSLIDDIVYKYSDEFLQSTILNIVSMKGVKIGKAK